MILTCVGLNPKTTPEEIWERILSSAVNSSHPSRPLTALAGVKEASLLVNEARLECYLVLNDGCDGLELTATHLAQLAALSTNDILPFLYMAEEEDAATHAFNAACLADSFAQTDMPILETIRTSQIVYRDNNATIGIIAELFNRALHIGERALDLSDLGKDGESLASIAIEISKRVFDDMQKLEVIVFGGGASELTATRLHEAGVRKFTVAHPSQKHAEEIARPLKAAIRTMDDIAECLSRVDIALVSADSLVLDARTANRIRKARRGRVLVVFDYAATPQMEAAFTDFDSAYVYSREDLKRLSGSNPKNNTREEESAIRNLIASETLSFAQWLETRHS